MKYRAVLIESDRGYAVGCPALAGCWSQGATETEALENIRDAIREYLEVKAELETEEFKSENAQVLYRDVELSVL